MGVMASQITGTSIVFKIYQFLKTNANENMKAWYPWSIAMETTCDRRFPLQRASNTESVSTSLYHQIIQVRQWATAI